MEKKEIKVQVKKEGKLAKRALRGFMRDNDQEQLHKFRVGMKKLRAVAFLIEQTTPHRHIHTELKPVKETYQLSGKVRDSYLHVKLAKTVPSAEKKYIDHEKLVMKKAAKKMRKNRPLHLKKLRRAETRLLKQIPKVEDKKVSQFYETELRSVAACLRSSNEMEQIHNCRKRLKVLLYNLPLVNGALDVTVNEEYLQEVQTTIGDWHDYFLGAKRFPELGDKAGQLMQDVKTMTKNFYEHATHVVSALTKKAE